MVLKYIIGIIIITVIFFGVLGYIYLNKNNFNSDDVIVKNAPSSEDTNILFLHHSTGGNIWAGGVKEWFEYYNKTEKTNYSIFELNFPKDSPYGWNNYPFDYWNIWINHAGEESYKEEPTLEIFTKTYDVIIWKHCFPVSDIEEDTGNPSINSEEKRLENYKLQYNSLKEKMKEFPNTKFIVWTISALTESSTTEEKAIRAQEFYNWVKNEWDEKGDNIFLWDFYILETEGELYMKNENAVSETDSHPNNVFSQKVAPYFCKRIVDVIEGRGDITDISGKYQK